VKGEREKHTSGIAVHESGISTFPFWSGGMAQAACAVAREARSARRASFAVDIVGGRAWQGDEFFFFFFFFLIVN
jgi:hypothetical protein